jgi:hypothetical protein
VIRLRAFGASAGQVLVRAFGASAGQVLVRAFGASAGQVRLLVVAMTLSTPVAAAAQPYAGTASPHAGSFEVSGGATWTRGYDAGGVAGATETRPGAAGGSPLTLFTTDAQVETPVGAVARLGIYLARRVSVEASVEYTRPVLRAHVGSDFEQAPDTDASETITSYLAGGSVLYHFGDGQFAPFVSGGAGYLRQLHEENAALLSGAEIHGGAGIKYWFGSGRHRFGIRAEAQVSSRSKSVGFEDKRRILPSAAAGVAYLF